MDLLIFETTYLTPVFDGLESVDVIPPDTIDDQLPFLRSDEASISIPKARKDPILITGYEGSEDSEWEVSW